MQKELAKYIDHTALKPGTTSNEIDQLVQEAAKYEFASVCINPYWVKRCYDQLKNTSVKVCTVIGFPLGATATEAKAFEVKTAIEHGATEVDMVINVGELKAGHDENVQTDIAEVVKAAKNQALVKVIIETSLLTEEEKIRACQLSKAAGADFVKTSTGFSGGGATAEDIKLMRATVGPEMGVKASGGVRDRETALAMIENGATRIGASAGIAIVEGGTGESTY
ncbi:Deoxyribose-phosphate aldolase [Lentibacillus sp. JNUCC-1]|uniref:deoxyribose-phosphate aldolase n=1 Tax=Lentibacillus sp. JNUCC-1 TaxID=2654513 RepID=UPI0012E80BA7|nr:deoxyribose-phosphate aldolase [Lentibacillus sp. JNUCC-1]MUV39591.1 Deoxyribose-phosphate aldolase [Lentibacillus sp. JNUCC-1]